MNKIFISVVFLLFFSFSHINAKSNLSKETQRLLQNSVMGYAHGIMKAAKTANPDTLFHLLDEKLYTTTVVWIQSWHFATVYMDAKLDTVDFTKIEQNENKATVETNEKWYYAYYYTETNATLYPEKEINYKVRYSLVYKNKKWMIQDINILSEKSIVDDPDILIYPREQANKRPYSIERKKK